MLTPRVRATRKVLETPPPYPTRWSPHQRMGKSQNKPPPFLPFFQLMWFPPTHPLRSRSFFFIAHLFFFWELEVPGVWLLFIRFPFFRLAIFPFDPDPWGSPGNPRTLVEQLTMIFFLWVLSSVYWQRVPLIRRTRLIKRFSMRFCFFHALERPGLVPVFYWQVHMVESTPYCL